jgi:uncharacterized protein (TIRG00374 family)
MKEQGRIIFASFYKDLPSLGFLSFVLIINIAAWTINYFTIYFLGLSVGIEIGVIPFLVILPIATLVAQIPITINGFGTRELVLINLFGLFGIDGVKVLSMSLLGIFVTGIIPSAIAASLILLKKRNKTSLNEINERKI